MEIPVLRFPANDQRLHSGIGRHADGLIELSGVNPGCGLFGPYIELSAGGYTARIQMAPGMPRRGRVEVNISARSGEIVIARRYFNLGELSSRADCISIDFFLTEPLAGCEVRLFCEAGVRATIAAVEIEDNNDELAPELMLEAQPAPQPPSTSTTIDILQMGWERRRTKHGAVPLLRGVVAVRARVVSEENWIAMQVCMHARVLDRVRPETALAGAEHRDEAYRRRDLAAHLTEKNPSPGGAADGPVQHVFNSWIDVSPLPRGFARLTMVFDSGSGTSTAREELVYIGDLAVTEANRRSGALVVLADADGESALEDRINAQPSVVYPARRQLLERLPRSVVVMEADALGDLAIAAPAIERLRRLLPDAELTGLVSPFNRDLAATLDLFDRVIVVEWLYDPRRRRRCLPLPRQVELRARLRELAPDLAIDLSISPDLRPLLQMSGAPVTVGFGPREFPWLSVGIETETRDPVNGGAWVSHSARILTLVESLGALLNHAPTVIRSRRTDRRHLLKLGIGDDDSYLLLHSGARWTVNRWPLSQFLELARLVISKSDLKVVLTVDDAAESEQVAAARLPAESFSHTARIPFAELDTLMSHCAALVTNDTGPKHVAALRGSKVISVHAGRANWQEWGQDGDGLIVTRHVPCYGCGISEPSACGKGLACLVHIRPAEVWAAVQQVMNRPPPRRIG